MRANPQAWKPYVADMIKKFRGKIYNGRMRTREGAAAVRELYNHLNRQKPVPQL